MYSSTIIGQQQLNYNQNNQGWTVNGLKNIKKETRGVFTKFIPKVDESNDHMMNARKRLNETKDENIKKYERGINPFQSINRNNDFANVDMKNTTPGLFNTRQPSAMNRQIIFSNVEAPVNALPYSRMKFKEGPCNTFISKEMECPLDKLRPLKPSKKATKDYDLLTHVTSSKKSDIFTGIEPDSKLTDCSIGDKLLISLQTHKKFYTEGTPSHKQQVVSNEIDNKKISIYGNTGVKSTPVSKLNQTDVDQGTRNNVTDDKLKIGYVTHKQNPYRKHTYKPDSLKLQTPIDITRTTTPCLKSLVPNPVPPPAITSMKQETHNNLTSRGRT